MKLKFELEIKCRDTLDLVEVYESLRDAIFEWQSLEKGINSVTVLPVDKPASQMQAEIVMLRKELERSANACSLCTFKKSFMERFGRGA